MRNQAGEKGETEEARAETGTGEATVRRNRERMHGKPGRKERGKPKARKQERSTEEATVRRRQEEEGKEETEAE